MEKEKWDHAKICFPVIIIDTSFLDELLIIYMFKLAN